MTVTTLPDPALARVETPNNKGARPIIVALRYSVSLAILYVLWWAAVHIGGAPPGLLPAPERVLHSLVTEWSLYYSDFAYATLSKAVIGGTIGIVGGLIVGLTLGYSQAARAVLEPYLTIFQSFPREALYPIFVVALGVGDRPQITNAALLSFFPVAVTTLNAISDTRKDYVDLVRSWGATRYQEFVYCRLPYIVPTLVGAFKLAVPFALIGAVLAEMLGGGTRSGLGNLIASAQAGQNATSTYCAILILAALGVGLVAAIQAIEYLALRRYRHG